MSNSSTERRVRPDRGSFLTNRAGDAAFNRELVRWQYDEIERLRTALEWIASSRYTEPEVAEAAFLQLVHTARSVLNGYAIGGKS